MTTLQSCTCRLINLASQYATSSVRQLSLAAQGILRRYSWNRIEALAQGSAPTEISPRLSKSSMRSHRILAGVSDQRVKRNARQRTNG